MEAEVHDTSDADLVVLSEASTRLDDGNGQAVGSLRAIEYVGGGSTPGGDPRHFTVQLRFSLDPSRASEAKSVRVVAHRYRSSEVPLEWSAGGGALHLPLAGAGRGFSAVVERMDLKEEADPSGNQHPTVALKAQGTADAMVAPELSFALCSMVTTDGAVLHPDMVTTHLSRTPLPEGATDDIQVLYHFFSVSAVPEVSKLSIDVRGAEPLERAEGSAPLPASQ